MSAVAPHPAVHVRPAALVPVLAVLVLAVALAVVLLLAPWQSAAPASSSSLTPATPATGGGPVAACPHLPVSAC